MRNGARQTASAGGPAADPGRRPRARAGGQNKGSQFLYLLLVHRRPRLRRPPSGANSIQRRAHQVSESTYSCRSWHTRWRTRVGGLSMIIIGYDYHWVRTATTCSAIIAGGLGGGGGGRGPVTGSGLIAAAFIHFHVVGRLARGQLRSRKASSRQHFLASRRSGGAYVRQGNTPGCGLPPPPHGCSGAGPGDDLPPPARARMIMSPRPARGCPEHGRRRTAAGGTWQSSRNGARRSLDGRQQRGAAAIFCKINA